MGGGAPQPVPNEQQNEQKNDGANQNEKTNNKKGKTSQKDNKNAAKENKPKTNKKGKNSNPDKSSQQKQNEAENIQKQYQIEIQPTCLNKKKATHVCLASKCKEYPFYCLQCQQSCEQLHHHEYNKAITVSIKELQKRIQTRKTVNPVLKESCNSYRQILQNLQESFKLFYKQSQSQLQMIEQKKQLPFQCKQIKRKIEKQSKSGLNGKLMKQKWDQTGDWKEQQKQFLQFLTKKKQLLLNLQQCFAIINKTDKDNQQDLESQNQKNEDEKNQNQDNRQLTTYHLYKRYQFDHQKLIASKEGVWSSSKKN